MRNVVHLYLLLCGFTACCRPSNFNNHYKFIFIAKPTGAQYDELSRPLDDWINIPGTQLKYTCPQTNWAFDYPYDATLPSFFFTPNLNNITIYCNLKG